MQSLTQYKDYWIILILLAVFLLARCATIGETLTAGVAPITTSDTPLRVEPVLEDAGLVTAMEFAADGRLYFAEKGGGIFTIDRNNPESAVKKQILELEVAEGTESGLLGLALATEIWLTQPAIRRSCPEACCDTMRMAPFLKTIPSPIHLFTPTAFATASV